ncbi:MULTISPECIES: PTS transporter subunit EIIC [Enterococcus]|jgi:PTS system beta-glucosides-specific IIC component|uniref:PTS transporter subunit EIIC n=1 Tax=Enterococcus TaxID=1350 RepID=UPI0003704936|nr:MULTISPECIES: PTS transporter subunit EIIC [Enterococcus]EPH67757.1 PTS system beta-glucoside-specific EIIBCA component family protein [Enterococcus faecium 13.SD.W.09]AUJ84095.1 PTS beta-glucoside transporter subunit IIABC [Enterococcus sp. CR-Ec1]MBE9893938.1 PTS transporter subunit EIIC [Enterococcus casseliflavus]MBO1120466.1 PTS beta-glucoside transporter subunit IIABC [Enterococcus casseliflavus]WEI92182.1 PTS transporter subunit EIIC [Enterococcus casseliflavus]
MDYKVMAKNILEKIGGADNVRNMTHCATRLRLTLHDTAKADDQAVENIDGVINVINKAGQYQLLIGTEVGKLYDEFEPLVKGNESAGSPTTEEQASGSIISNVFSAVSAIFAPLLPVLAGSGILRGLLILFVQLGLISEDSGTYSILFVASMSVFYFLPVLLAFTSARRFGASPYISALIGAALINPDFIALMGGAGNGATTEFFGIPVVLMNYNSTVVPIILSIWAFSYLYKFLDKHIPETLKLVVVPLVSLAIMVPLTVIVIGPIGVYSGEAVANVVNWLIERSSVLTGILVGGGWSVLVSLGIHWAVNPIMINNVSTYGFDYIVPFTFACNFAVIGTTIGVYFKAKDKKLRSFALTGLVTIALSAIIEATLFGLLVKNKKLFLAQIIGGAVGGAYLGLMQVVTNAFVFGSVTTFPAFVGSTSSNFIQAMIGLLISMVVSAVLAFVFTNRDETLA